MRAALAGAVLPAAAGCAAPAGGGGAETTVTIFAGPVDRASTPVSFPLPAAAAKGEWQLVSADGVVLPVQRDDLGRGHLILPSLARFSEATFRLERASRGPEVVTLERGEGAVAFHIGGRPVLQYNAAVTNPPRDDVDPVYARGGYIHPIHSPAGTVVTGDYPPDHVHHHGVWAAWTRTLFRGDTVDFWNVADRRGDVLPVALDSAWGGPVFGGFTARHRYVALTDGAPVDALHERWTAHVYAVEGGDRPYWLFDLEVEQRTAGSEPLVLPPYHYGGVAFRGRDDWYGADNAHFVTSAGDDRIAGNETRVRWTHLRGMADGGLRGVAVLSHPDNFRHPEPVRIHPREPYFVWTPSQLGEWTIAPGDVHRVRYRYVVHDGLPDTTGLDRLWMDFASPPRVEVR